MCSIRTFHLDVIEEISDGIIAVIPIVTSLQIIKELYVAQGLWVLLSICYYWGSVKYTSSSSDNSAHSNLRAT